MILTGCSQTNSHLITSPSYFQKLANADLSAKHNGRHKRNAYFGGSSPNSGLRSVEKYPGVDSQNFRVPNFKGVKDSGNGYELNFNNADLAELTKVIFKDTLKMPYVYDPRVQGRVTLATSGPISKEELLMTYETILQMNNATLINGDKLYKIVPRPIARSVGTLTLGFANENNTIKPGFGITVMPLKHISAHAILNLLKSFISDKNKVKTDVQGSVLFVRGTSRDRRALINIARMFDVDWMRGQSAGIYVLKNAAPVDVISDLRQIFQVKAGLGKGVVRFKTIDRLNAVLVLTSKSKVLDKVEVWLRRLDRTNTEAENVFVYRVENGKAKELAKLLTATLSGGGASVSRGSEESDVAPNQSAVKSASNSGDSDDNQNETVVEKTSTSSSFSQVSTLAANRSGGNFGAITITADEVNNKLLIKASGRDYRKILKVLKKIDRAPLQVLINATLAEVTLNDQLRYGVQFFLQANSGRRKGAIGFSTGDALKIAAGQLPGLNFLVGSQDSPKVVLDALANETNVKVVSSPSVVVLHNQKAKLQVGDEIPVLTKSVTTVEGGVINNNVVSNEVEFRKTGVILNVIPRVNSNGLVTMEVEQEISSVANQVTSGEAGNLTPTISQRKISSTIAVNSGQMVVLGGLISERSNVGNSGIPGVRKIPLLGKIVGADNNRLKARTELVVFLQPTIIRNAEDAADIAQSLRDGLLSMSPGKKVYDEEEPRHYDQVAGKSHKEKSFK